MAKIHRQQVGALVEKMGREKGLALARERLRPWGVELGRRIKRLLGVGDTPEELEKGARIAYRALGIDFELTWVDSGKAEVRFFKCALSPVYDPDTCRALTFADEGMFEGLCPQARLVFTEHNPGGGKPCLALLEFQSEEP